MLNRDEVLEMARSTGTTKWYGTLPDGTNKFERASFSLEQLERFAALVAERTREECANVCCIQMDGEECAEAIRSKAY